MTEVVLQGPRVVAIIGQFEPASMAKDREWHLGDLADALDESVEADGADWSPRSETNTWASVG